MATCEHCGQAVIRTTYAGQPLLLDPGPLTYAAVDEHPVWPEEGMRVFRSLALVDHRAVCPATRGEPSAAPETTKAAKVRQKGAKV
jgi:hypothetical protein